jgi:anti-sigma B factor antagonist
VDTGRMEVIDEAGACILALFGEHDMDSAPALNSELTRLLDSGAPIVVDLTQVDFIESVAIQAVIAGHTLAAEMLTGALVGVVVAPNTEPDRVWTLIGLRDRVPTFATRREAIAAASLDG